MIYHYILICLLLVCNVFSFGKSTESAGLFLELDPSPISTSLGKAVISNPDDSYAVIHNPASMLSTKHNYINYAYNSFYSLMNQSYLGGQYKLSPYFALGAGIQVLQIEDIFVVDDNDTVLGQLQNSYQSVSLGMAVHIKFLENIIRNSFINRFFVGLTAQHLSVNIHDNKARSIVTNVGILMALSDKRWLGLKVKNIMGSTLDWDTESAAKEPIFRQISLGYKWELFSRWTSFTELSYDEISIQDKTIC